jgi:hypothetical protein
VGNPISTRVTGLSDFSPIGQGCQMVYFKTKKWNWGKFFRAMQWKMLGSLFYDILRPFDICRYFMDV